MPVLDTVVLFAAADYQDRAHEKALHYMKRLRLEKYYMASFSLLEFDIVLKSRGITFDERMEKYALLMRDYPAISEKIHSISPTTLYLLATLERDVGMEYFDAAIASEALQVDGNVVSNDKAFKHVRNLRMIW